MKSGEYRAFITRGGFKIGVSELETEYNMLLKLWASGSHDYINLTSSYLIANSILVAAIAIILKIEDKFTVVALSVIGIILCIQMYMGLSLLRTQNAYWRRNLKIIEKDGDWKRSCFFNEFYEFRDSDKPESLPSIKDVVDEFKPDFAIKHHNEFWASRINSLPLLFVMLYTLFIIHASIAIHITVGELIVLIGIIYLVLSYLLKYFSDC